MKRFTTKIMDKGEEKVIAVWLDDETARLLDEYGDEKLKHAYIVEEYKAQLIERRETRRHQSLEKSMEAGFDVEEVEANFESDAVDKTDLLQAICALPDSQRFVIEQYYFSDMRLEDIANKKGVSIQAIAQMIRRAKMNIKKFLKNF